MADQGLEAGPGRAANRVEECLLLCQGVHGGKRQGDKASAGPEAAPSADCPDTQAPKRMGATAVGRALIQGNLDRSRGSSCACHLNTKLLLLASIV